MAIGFEKGLKIKDYQNMINARDKNLEKKRNEIADLSIKSRKKLAYSIVFALLFGIMIGILL